ncbi:CarD family transcriptional regulator [Planococcus beigongshangi]|uniref:CarD family transcriptional regulator n=1 Tax=Planococcus beigongshangi TaxID=2782536 RepID=UPI00193B1AB9|nr:CarD family transcriptional regulator [Planococcus beigongshangi]
MFNIGDQIIYSTHGLCIIDDIREETIAGVTRKYYLLHPTENHHRITIRTPVDNDKVVMLSLMKKDAALDIIKAFEEAPLEWAESPNARFNYFSDILNTGDRQSVAQVVNTLMRRKIDAKLEGKNLYERDHKILNSAQSILFKELALALDITFEEVNQLIAGQLEKEPAFIH